MGTEQIDPSRDRVWAVHVEVSFRAYVVAETNDEAERIANRDVMDIEPDFSARELTKPLEQLDDDGRSHWDGHEITVNEAVDLLMPAYDHLTELMPFAESPPPLYPQRLDDYLAAGREAR
jgi:hypothetical protein